MNAQEIFEMVGLLSAIGLAFYSAWDHNVLAAMGWFVAVINIMRANA